jgi:hypothetical protein
MPRYRLRKLLASFVHRLRCIRFLRGSVVFRLFFDWRSTSRKNKRGNDEQHQISDHDVTLTNLGNPCQLIWKRMNLLPCWTRSPICQYPAN